MRYPEVPSENCREKLGAVMTLVRLYAQEIVNHTTVIVLSCEIDKDKPRKEGPDNLDQISKSAKRIGAVAYKLATLEAEYRDCAILPPPAQLTR